MTGNLKADMENVQLKPVVTSSDLGFTPPPEISLSERTLISLGSSPPELLYALLSGEYKKVKRAAEMERVGKKRQQVTKKLPTSFYTASLKIPEKNILHFIEFCETKKNLEDFSHLDPIEFIEAMQEIAVEYKEKFPERF